MSEVTQAAEFPASGQVEPRDYDAFLSYTHRDRPVVSGIQKGLHRIGRRLGQLRALRVFRDDTDLAASPDLFGKITEALDRSRFFVVTLSPGAAASHWVNQEISYWLEPGAVTSCCWCWLRGICSGTNRASVLIRGFRMRRRRC